MLGGISGPRGKGRVIRRLRKAQKALGAAVAIDRVKLVTRRRGVA